MCVCSFVLCFVHNFLFFFFDLIVIFRDIVCMWYGGCISRLQSYEAKSIQYNIAFRFWRIKKKTNKEKENKSFDGYLLSKRKEKTL